MNSEFRLTGVWETRRCGRGCSDCSDRSSARSVSCGWIWQPAVDHHRVGGRGDGRRGDECRHCCRSQFELCNGTLQRRCHRRTFRDQSQFPVPRDKHLDGSALSRPGKHQPSHRSSKKNPLGDVGDLDTIDNRQQQLRRFQPLSKSDCRLRRRLRLLDICLLCRSRAEPHCRKCVGRNRQHSDRQSGSLPCSCGGLGIGGTQGIDISWVSAPALTPPIKTLRRGHPALADALSLVK